MARHILCINSRPSVRHPRLERKEAQKAGDTGSKGDIYSWEDEARKGIRLSSFQRTLLSSATPVLHRVVIAVYGASAQATFQETLA